ncbi:MAG: exo-alpha-sialidase [Candidatus Brocadiia bacterium]
MDAKKSDKTVSTPDIAGSLTWIGPIDRDSPTLGLPTVDGVRRTTLYAPGPDDDSFSHHGYITHHNGALFATWSNHARDEDAAGQRVRFSLSTNKGATWREPVELFPPHDRAKLRAEQDVVRDRVVIANGFAVVDDTLYAIAEVHTLGERRDTTPPPGIAPPSDAESRTFSCRPGLGRLARSLDTKGKTGPIFWLVDNPPPPLPNFPSYPRATEPAFRDLARAINAYLARPEHWPTWDFVHQTTRPWAPDGHRLCEPTQAWTLPDGSMARLWRDLTHGSGVQYAQIRPAQTTDWAPPVRTDFPDAYSRAAAGNLPGGTAYVINNPGRGRDPIVISLAADGLTFDRHAVLAAGAPPRRFEGVAKGPGFQYPRATVVDETLFVIYSVNKEDMEVAAIRLKDLYALERQ